MIVDWITNNALSLFAVLLSLISIIVAILESKKSRKYVDAQLAAQNFNNRIAYESWRESVKTPSAKKADDLARRGGFSTHASYLARHDIGECKDFKVDN